MLPSVQSLAHRRNVIFCRYGAAPSTFGILTTPSTNCRHAPSVRGS
jgi:hypothetical protein